MRPLILMADFSAIDWAVVGLASLIVLAGTVPLRGMWRGDARAVEPLRQWWPYGDRFWQGWKRALPTTMLVAWLMLIAVVALGLNGVFRAKPLRVIAYVGSLGAIA